MTTVKRAVATLRIIGDSLIPAEISHALEAQPSECQTKGQEIKGKSGQIRIAKFGSWAVHAAETSPANFDAQALEILSRLSSDLAVWSNLRRSFDVDLFCGWFLEKENEMLGISAATLMMLGERGIDLSLDIYAAD